ncbi:MAG: PEP-CTERM sorting domain-containing protein [Candidatus Merdousia sp.]|nr:PEP-CTERM sorting domain-containing protein [Candidatus Merdousia sp.]
MRKTATIVSLFATSFAFAAFTETETDFKGVNGWTISGSGSASEIVAQNTTALLLDNATIDFDSTDGLEIKVGSGAAFQYANYSIGIKGDVVLNFKSGSNASLNASKGIATSYNGGQYGGNLTVNVEKGYLGKLSVPIYGCASINGQNTKLTMNLHSAYALDKTRIFVNRKTTISMSADQSLIWDVRNSTDKGILALNITDGASLFVTGKGYGVDSSNSSSVKLMGENLLDGYIYFVSSMVASFDNDAKTITLRGSNGGVQNLHTVSFVDNDGNAVNSDSYANFEIGETVINGVAYHYATMAAIPEPATWAAIFGAIALGLAVYRRRK